MKKIWRSNRIVFPKKTWSLLKNSKPYRINWSYLSIAPLSNSSVLPTDLPQLTNKQLDSINFLSCDITKIISHLDPDKAHGHDMLSIQMIKLFGNSICKPLSKIVNDCLNEGKFPHEWKTLYLYRTKETSRVWKTIGQFLICNKIFERLINNKIFTFFSKNNLISPNQSGFRPGDSYVNQLLAITHELFKPFDERFY